MTKQRKREVICLIAIVILALVVVEIAIFCNFSKNHFLGGTQIGEVDCSYLTINSAMKKVAEKYREQKCEFTFSTGEIQEVSLGKLGVELDETKFAECFNEQHENREAEREYDIEEVISVDKKWLEVELRRIPQLQEQNMQKPENARVEWNGTTFYVWEHVLGTEVNFEDALLMTADALENGIFKVDFTSITNMYPEILSSDVLDEVKELNSVILNSIQFELSNGEIVTLDNSIMKNWVTKNSDGYFIDTENGIANFVEELAVKVDEAEAELHFMPTYGDQEVVVQVPNELRACLNKEKEIAEIKAAFDSNWVLKPRLIYTGYPVSTRLNDIIELDQTRQTVWLYRDSNLVVETECVTANLSQNYNTPEGVFTVLNKAEKTVLRGFNRDGSRYAQEVDYWVGFFEDYGFHDSPRTQFGGDIYKTSGSHGCVNMPGDKMEVFFNNVYEGMLVISYKS